MAKNVSKRFVITIAAKDAKKVKVLSRDGFTEIDLRTIHLGMLESLFSAAANNQRDLAKSIQCVDCGQVVENLIDSETELVFTKDDIDFLKKGWEVTVEKRPDAWSKALDLMVQIDSPKEKIDSEPEAK